MPTRAKLFVSHITEEAEVATLLKDMLEDDFLGLVDFFISSDIGNIGAGKDWLVAIQKALDEAAIVLVLCSRASVQRPWVQFEVGAAWMKGVPIVPVCHSGMVVADLQMPLSLRHGIELGTGFGLERLYAAVATELKLEKPPRLTDLPARLQRIADVEERFRNSGTKQFEQFFDVVIPSPGRLTTKTIPDNAQIISDPASLQVFGLAGGVRWRWKDVVRAAQRTPDTRWLAQLQQSIYLASNDMVFEPVQAVFHAERRSYQPQLARKEVYPNGDSRFHVHLVDTVVAPLTEVDNDFGLLATLLRLGLRFRYEVIERFRKLRPDEAVATLRCAIEVIEKDALSRGAQNIDAAAVAALFDRAEDQDEMAGVNADWETARAALFAQPEPTPAEVVGIVASMRALNYRFMSLGTRRFHEMVRGVWGEAPRPLRPKLSGVARARAPRNATARPSKAAGVSSRRAARSPGT